MKISNFFVAIFCFIASCSYSFEEKEVIGVYVGNGPFENDSIHIFSNSVYFHYGINKVNNSKFCDTGSWKVDNKSNELIFYKFCFHNNPNESPTGIQGMWISKIFQKNKIIHFNINREQEYFYKKVDD